MTVRYGIADHPISRIMWAGDGVCVCCARPFYMRTPTVEHVIPRRPRQQDAAKAKAMRKFLQSFHGSWGIGVKAAAHDRCNSRKGNRLPTGCELVFLMAVNARLDPRKSEKRLVRERRRRCATKS